MSIDFVAGSTYRAAEDRPRLTNPEAIAAVAAAGGHYEVNPGNGVLLVPTAAGGMTSVTGQDGLLVRALSAEDWATHLRGGYRGEDFPFRGVPLDDAVLDRRPPTVDEVLDTLDEMTGEFVDDYVDGHGLTDAELTAADARRLNAVRATYNGWRMVLLHAQEGDSSEPVQAKHVADYAGPIRNLLEGAVFYAEAGVGGAALDRATAAERAGLARVRGLVAQLVTELDQLTGDQPGDDSGLTATA